MHARRRLQRPGAAVEVVVHAVMKVVSKVREICSGDFLINMFPADVPSRSAGALGGAFGLDR